MLTNKTRHTMLQPPPGFASQSWSANSPAVEVPDDVAAVVFVIDSSAERSKALRQTLEGHAFEVQVFSDCQTFLTHHQAGRRGCILVDVSSPRAGGIEFISKLKSSDCRLAVIAVAASFSPARVVEAMKAGANDCLETPIEEDTLVSTLERVITEADMLLDPAAFRSLAVQRVATLTPRQREVLDLITTGHPSKNIAADLRISQRTVENHRAAIARKTCSRSLSDVVHTAICANCSLMKVRH